MSKYEKFDRKLLAWIAENQSDLTTNQAIADLNVTSKTLKRHVGKRFSQLRDWGYLESKQVVTAKVCWVVKPLPKTFSRPKWKATPITPSKPSKALPTGATVEEFLANGGVIEVLPTQEKPRTSRPARGYYWEDTDPF